MNNEDLPRLIADNTLLEWIDELDGFPKILIILASLYIESNGNNGQIQNNEQTTRGREGDSNEEPEARPDTEEGDDVYGQDGESLSEY